MLRRERASCASLSWSSENNVAPAWSRWYTRTLPDFDEMKLPGYLSDSSLTCPPIAVDSAICCQEHVAASQVAGDKQLSMYLRYTPIPPRYDGHQRNSPSNGSGLPRARDLLLCCSSPALPVCMHIPSLFVRPCAARKRFRVILRTQQAFS